MQLSADTPKQLGWVLIEMVGLTQKKNKSPPQSTFYHFTGEPAGTAHIRTGLVSLYAWCAVCFIADTFPDPSIRLPHHTEHRVGRKSAQLLRKAGTCQQHCRNFFPNANGSQVQAASHHHATSGQRILKRCREQSRLVNEALKTVASALPAPGLSGVGRVVGNSCAGDTTPPKAAQRLEDHV